MRTGFVHLLREVSWAYKPRLGLLCMAYSYPMSDDIKQFANDNERFEASLKMLNDDEYITPNTIILTYPDTLPKGTQVIGLFFAHKASIAKNTGIQFKQVYIIKKLDGTSTSVTKTATPNGQVMPTEMFAKKVGAGKHYGTDKGNFDHWYYSVDELPDIIRPEAQEISLTLTAQSENQE